MSYVPGVAALMVSMGIEEPEEQAAIWSCLQPLTVPVSPAEAMEQIRAVQNGGDLTQWLPNDEDEQPDEAERDLEGTLEDSRGELLSLIEQAPSGEEIWDVIYDLAVMLLRKNMRYQNSALEPLRLFSRADDVEQLRVRLDDKLSRLRNQSSEDEDVVADLMGYLVLLRVAESKR